MRNEKRRKREGEKRRTGDSVSQHILRTTCQPPSAFFKLIFVLSAAATFLKKSINSLYVEGECRPFFISIFRMQTTLFPFTNECREYAPNLDSTLISDGTDSAVKFSGIPTGIVSHSLRTSRQRNLKQ